VTSRPARPSHARPTVESVPVAVLVVLGVIFSFLVTGIAATPAGLVPLTGLLLFVLVAMTPLVVAEASYLLRRRGPEWLRSAGRRLPQGVRVAAAIAAVAGLITGEIIAARAVTGDDGKRCVEFATMVVVGPSHCENQGGATNPAVGPATGWYYGGTGTRVGGTAQDGSFSAPGTDGGDGGGGD
jgi:hypothetical protein